MSEIYKKTTTYLSFSHSIFLILQQTSLEGPFGRSAVNFRSNLTFQWQYLSETQW